MRERRGIRALWRKVRIRWVVALLALVGIQVLMRVPAWCEWYARTVYPVLMEGLSAFSGLFPFSIGDCFIYGSLLFLVGYLAWTGMRRRRMRPALAFVGEYLVWVYIWFYLAWGLNYFREDFHARSGLPDVRFSAEDFASFLEDYTEGLNAAYLAVEGRVDSLDAAVMPEVVATSFRGTRMATYGLAPLPSRLRAKPMLFSRAMSGVGVTGYMGPFFSEFHLNRQLLPSQYPFTYVHELSHLLGIANEAEANFHAYRVCVASELPAVRFSGYFSLLPYVAGNAMRVLDEAAYKAWLESLRPEILALHDEKAAYWRALYSPLVGRVQDWLYNLFLKGNQIPSGTANYSEVIALLIAERKAS